MLNKTIETLIEYNNWRRGGLGEMLDPKIIGEAIDHAIEVLTQADNLINTAKGKS